MSLRSWYNQHVQGNCDWREAAYQFYVGALRQVGAHANYGTPVWADDWEVLVVLDACRYDLLAEVAPVYEWFNAVDSRFSLASTSREWMRKNFAPEHREHVARTAYVTGNVFSEDAAPAQLAAVREVWREAWDADLGTVPARAVTDEAIRTWRETRADRLIVHYMQPHYPFVPSPLGAGMRSNDGEVSVWTRLRREDSVTRRDVWARYRENLRHVLGEVAALVASIDAEVVVTSDHGNLLGEFGLYGHPGYVPVPALKRVPWVTVDKNGVRVDEIRDPESSARGTETDVDEQLRRLGYK